MNILTQLHRQLSLNGPRNTAKAIAGKLWRMVTPPKPDPWLAFDRLYGIDTSGTEVPDENDCVGDNWMSGQRYQGCNPENLQRALHSLKLNWPDKATFVDLGSGKGRALFVASSFPFAHVRGVEYSHKLHQAALHNIALTVLDNVTSECADASTATFTEGPQVVFCYNAFGSEIMAKVINNLLKHSYPVTFIYMGKEDTGNPALLRAAFKEVSDDGWTHIFKK